ncbi:MAG: ATP-NAD kinase family protein, partial [Candidatus Thorarchaeota archaeon]
ILLDAKPESPMKAIRALEKIKSHESWIDVITYPSEMGEAEALEAGLSPIVIGSITSGATSAKDTMNASKEMSKFGVDLILFAGGDGTARDIYDTMDKNIPILGIPSGVKIQSSVFSVNPERAGELAVIYLQGEALLKNGEIIDIDEDAFRFDMISSRLYGYAQVPYKNQYVQASKSGTPSVPNERANQRAIADYLVENMDDGIYLLGPGTSVKAIADALGIQKTLLGVDVIQEKQIIHMDVNESQILDILKDTKAKIVVTPIGGQGFIFGRGNQQFSSDIIKKVGKDNIIVVATPNKLVSIGIGEPLRLDTGDSETNELLSGYIRVITGYAEEAVILVQP